MYKHLAGLESLTPGFTKVKMEPVIISRLGYLNCSFRSAAGLWKTAWKVMDKEHVSLDVTVPLNCSAELKLPLCDEPVQVLTSGSYHFEYAVKEPIRVEGK